MQLLLYVEEMQSQQRAENGIEEIIIGYADQDDLEPDELDANDIGMFADMGTAYELALADLPDDVRDVLLAEQHRQKTGEVITVETFKRQQKETSG